MKSLFYIVTVLFFISCSTNSNFSKRKYTKGKIGHKRTTGKKEVVKQHKPYKFIQKKKNITPQLKAKMVKPKVAENVLVNPVKKLTKTNPQLVYIHSKIDTPETKKKTKDSLIKFQEKAKKPVKEKKKFSTGKAIGSGLSLALGITFLIGGIVLIYTSETFVLLAIFSMMFGLVSLIIGIVFLFIAALIAFG